MIDLTYIDDLVELAKGVEYEHLMLGSGLSNENDMALH